MANAALNLIDEEIRRLQELRRMAEDPHMLDLMRKLSHTNGTTLEPAITRADPVQPPAVNKRPARNVKAVGLTEGITKAVRRIDTVFTIHDVRDAINRDGVKIHATRPMIAISGILQRLVARNEIKCVEKGKAGQPSKYRRIEFVSPELPLS